jgi:hypothetical protein
MLRCESAMWVVEVIPVAARQVADVGLEDDERSSGPQNPVAFPERVQEDALRGHVLEDVGRKDDINRARADRSEVVARRSRPPHFDRELGHPWVEVDGNLPFAADGVHELTPARAQIDERPLFPHAWTPGLRPPPANPTSATRIAPATRVAAAATTRAPLSPAARIHVRAPSASPAARPTARSERRGPRRSSRRPALRSRPDLPR